VPLYLEEIEDPAQIFPESPIYLPAHAGTSKELHRHQDNSDFSSKRLQSLLRKTTPNRVYRSVLDRAGPLLLAEIKEVKPMPNWVKAGHRFFPDRFMLGSGRVGASHMD